MNTQLKNQAGQAEPRAGSKGPIRVFAIGRAGAAIVEELINMGLDPSCFALISRDPAVLGGSRAGEKIMLPPDAALQNGQVYEAPECEPAIKRLCAGTDYVFVVAALGGLTGAGLAPCVAKLARDDGRVVFCFATLPFDYEGSLRQARAGASLRQLKTCAHGVVCLRTQKLLKLVSDNTPLSHAFKLPNALLAGAVQNVWRMLTCRGPLAIHLPELCMVLGRTHGQAAFAVAEVCGPDRAKKAVEELLSSPMLDSGQALRQARALIVSVAGGADLTVAEVNWIVEQLQRHCPNIPLVTGAAIDATLGDRLALTLLAGIESAVHEDGTVEGEAGSAGTESGSRSFGGAELEPYLIRAEETPRPKARVVPPPPELSQEKIQELYSERAQTAAARRIPGKLRQGQLKLEIVSKGRFDKSEPTIYKGEDLDLPTFIRRGIVLN